MATLARVCAPRRCSVRDVTPAGATPARPLEAASSCGAGKIAYKSQTTTVARIAAPTRVSITPAPRMFAWTVRTGTIAVAFSSMVAGSEGRPTARSRIAKPMKNSSPSAAVSISGRSEKTAETAKAAPAVAAITATSATAWRGRGGRGMPTRICAASTAVSPGSGSLTIVPQTIATVAAKASRRAERCRAISGDKSQYRDQPDPEPGERIKDRVLAGVEDDAGAGIVAHAAWWAVSGLKRQINREALRRCEPSAGALVRLRQACRGIHIALADAPAEALHPRRQHTAGQDFEHHLGSRTGADVLQAVLTHEGAQPYQARVKESQRRLTGGRELPDIELQVGYHTIAGCAQGGAGEIEACLLKRGQRLADLRIVGALWTERLARLLQRGLGTLHLRLGRVQLRTRLVAFRLCIDANAHQLKDPGRLLANVVPLRDLLHQLRLGLIYPGSGGADGLPSRGELGLGTLHGDAERGGVDPVEQIAGPNDLVVLHRDLDDLPRDLRSDAHHEGADAGVAGVRCQPVGNQRPAEQQNPEDEDDERPAP